MKITLESPEGMRVTIESGKESVTMLSDLLDMFIAAAVGVTYNINSVHDAICDKASELIEIDENKS